MSVQATRIFFCNLIIVLINIMMIMAVFTFNYDTSSAAGNLFRTGEFPGGSEYSNENKTHGKTIKSGNLDTGDIIKRIQKKSEILKKLFFIDSKQKKKINNEIKKEKSPAILVKPTPLPSNITAINNNMPEIKSPSKVECETTISEKSRFILNAIENEKYGDLEYAGTEAIDNIIQRFNTYSYTDKDKVKYIHALSKIKGAEKRYYFFIKMINDYCDDSIKKAAIEAIYQLKIHNADINAALSICITKGNSEVRTAALKTLAASDEQLYLKTCIDTLKKSYYTSEYKTDVILSMSELKFPLDIEAHDILLNFLADKNTNIDGSIKAASAKILGDFKCEDAIAVLMEAIRFDSDKVSKEAATSLVKFSGKAVKPLMKELDNYISAKSAIYILAEIGTNSVTLLSQNNSHPSQYVRENSLRALEKNRSEYSKAAVTYYLNDQVKFIRSLASSILMEKNWKPNNPDDEMSRDIAAGNWNKLEKFGIRAVKYLIELIKRENFDEISMAAEELSRFDPEIYLPLLLGLIDEGNYRIENNIICALARSGNPALKPLIKTLKNGCYNNEFGRRIAKTALYNMKNISAPVLVEDYIVSGSHEILDLLLEINENAAISGYITVKIKNNDYFHNNAKINAYRRLLHKITAINNITNNKFNRNYYLEILLFFIVWVFSAALVVLSGSVDVSSDSGNIPAHFILKFQKHFIFISLLLLI